MVKACEVVVNVCARVAVCECVGYMCELVVHLCEPVVTLCELVVAMCELDVKCENVATVL